MLNKHKKKDQEKPRVIARNLARELSKEEMNQVAGGTTSYKNCVADDCDVDRS